MLGRRDLLMLFMGKAAPGDPHQEFARAHNAWIVEWNKSGERGVFSAKEVALWNERQSTNARLVKYVKRLYDSR